MAFSTLAQSAVEVGKTEGAALRVKFSELPLAVQELITGIRQGHRANKREKLAAHQAHSFGIKATLREQYAALIEKIADCFRPAEHGFTHFRITREGDVVFVSNAANYGRAFKRLWGLHLPLF